MRWGGWVGNKANVAGGYHAIEFLLWGQDLNGSNSGAGIRSHLDYSLTECAHAPCQRRREYLLAMTQLLISDLLDITASFRSGEASLRLLSSMPDQILATALINNQAGILRTYTIGSNKLTVKNKVIAQDPALDIAIVAAFEQTSAL
jgi:uncharacterized iron-regulated protein